MTWNSRAIAHRHLKQTHAYRRDRQTEHKCLGAAPKLAELVKVVVWVNPEIEIVGNHGEPKRRVQNAGNTPPSHGRHVSDNPPARSWFRRLLAFKLIRLAGRQKAMTKLAITIVAVAVPSKEKPA
jgi:hypothetical protein